MKRESLIVLIFLGSLWGAVEVFLGDFLYSIGAFHPSIILTSIALGILASGRRYFPKAGSSTFIGAIAVLFRLINASPYYCHLFAIFFDALAFDVMATILATKTEKSFVWRGIMGSSSAYLGYALFGFIMTYLIHYPHWVRAGLPGILNYLGFRGTLAAIGSFFTVPIGYILTGFLKYGTSRVFKLRSAQVWGLFLAFTLFLWAVGRMA